MRKVMKAVTRTIHPDKANEKYREAIRATEKVFEEENGDKLVEYAPVRLMVEIELPEAIEDCKALGYTQRDLDEMAVKAVVQREMIEQGVKKLLERVGIGSKGTENAIDID